MACSELCLDAAESSFLLGVISGFVGDTHSIVSRSAALTGAVSSNTGLGLAGVISC